MIWSKARWCAQEERNTRYFFNLERRNHPNKYITEVKTENLTLTHPTQNLKEEYHYKNLYTSNFTNPNDYDFVEFFESTTLSKLTRKVDLAKHILPNNCIYCSLCNY